jgi:hypothetical protein
LSSPASIYSTMGGPRGGNRGRPDTASVARRAFFADAALRSDCKTG